MDETQKSLVAIYLAYARNATNNIDTEKGSSAKYFVCVSKM